MVVKTLTAGDTSRHRCVQRGTLHGCRGLHGRPEHQPVFGASALVGGEVCQGIGRSDYQGAPSVPDRANPTLVQAEVAALADETTGE